MQCKNGLNKHKHINTTIYNINECKELDESGEYGEYGGEYGYYELTEVLLFSKKL